MLMMQNKQCNNNTRGMVDIKHTRLFIVLQNEHNKVKINAAPAGWGQSGRSKDWLSPAKTVQCNP